MMLLECLVQLEVHWDYLLDGVSGILSVIFSMDSDLSQKSLNDYSDQKAKTKQPFSIFIDILTPKSVQNCFFTILKGNV